MSSSPTSTRHSPVLITIVVVATFLLLDTEPWWLFRAMTDEPTGMEFLVALTAYRWLPYLVVPLIVTLLLFGPRRSASSLGLNRSPIRGLAPAAAITIVLPLTYMAMTPFRLPEEPLREVLQYALLPGIGEEILYRGFLFGLLFRFAGWGFLPAGFLGAILFGVGHVSQGGDLKEAVSIFAITASGAVWFAWLYAEWDYNIWVPVGFHTLMNFWWLFFEISDTAAGPAYANVARLVVILASIIVTVLMARRRQRWEVAGRRWLRGPAAR